MFLSLFWCMNLELEQNNALPFLDVLITKTNTGSFHHTVYRKPTHTNRYLHSTSHHHPAQLNSILKTLTHRATLLTDQHNMKKELTALHEAFQKNGYTTSQIHAALNKKKPTTEETEENRTNKVILPYIKGTTDKISKTLKKHNIRTIFNTDRKIHNMFRTPQQKITNDTTGVYEIPCADCNRTYVGQSNRRIHERMWEHIRSVKKGDNTSALSQHLNSTGHNIAFEQTKTIATIANTSERKIRETIEIYKRPNSLNNREDSKNLNVMWKMLLPVHTPTHRIGQPTQHQQPITEQENRPIRHQYNTRNAYKQQHLTQTNTRS